MKFRIDIQSVITPNLAVTVFTFLTSFLIWFGFFYFFPSASISMQGFIGASAASVLPSNSLLAHAVSFVLMVFSALFIAQLNNKYAIINTRTFLPTFIFTTLSTCWISTHGNYLSYLAALLMLFSLYILLEMYRNGRATEPAFLGFFVLAVATAIIPEFIFLIPFIWLGMGELKGLSIRTFFASALGFIAPWVILYAIIFLVKGDFSSLPDAKNIVSSYSLYNVKNTPIVIYFSFLAAVLIFCIYGMMKKMNFENIKVRKSLSFFRFVGFGLFLISIFKFSNIYSYLPLIAFFYALIGGYTFTFQRNTFHSVAFILLIAGSFVFFFFFLMFSL